MDLCRTCSTFTWLALALCMILIMLSTAASFILCPLIYLVMLGDLSIEWLCPGTILFVVIHASISHFCTNVSVIYPNSKSFYLKQKYGVIDIDQPYYVKH
jgi:hypothetical protein